MDTRIDTWRVKKRLFTLLLLISLTLHKISRIEGIIEEVEWKWGRETFHFIFCVAQTQKRHEDDLTKKEEKVVLKEILWRKQ